jgi:hypothetical protein
MDDLSNKCVAIIILPSGEVIFHIPEEELTEEQLSKATTFSVVIEPSIFLWFALTLEVVLMFLDMKLKEIWARIRRK